MKENDSARTVTFDGALVPTVRASTERRSPGESTASMASGGAEQDAPQFQKPSLPERYEDLGPIASGGSGDVRRVRDRLLDRVAAMKLIRHEHLGSERMRVRFLLPHARGCPALPRALLDGVQPYEPVAKKRPGWEREDEAARLRRRAVLRETEWLQEIHELSKDVEPWLREVGALAEGSGIDVRRPIG